MRGDGAASYPLSYWRRTCLFDDQLTRFFTQPTKLCAILRKLCVHVCVCVCVCTVCVYIPFCSHACTPHNTKGSTTSNPSCTHRFETQRAQTSAKGLTHRSHAAHGEPAVQLPGAARKVPQEQGPECRECGHPFHDGPHPGAHALWREVPEFGVPMGPPERSSEGAPAHALCPSPLALTQSIPLLVLPLLPPAPVLSPPLFPAPAHACVPAPDPVFALFNVRGLLLPMSGRAL